MPPQVMQEFLKKQFFPDPIHWREVRRSCNAAQLRGCDCMDIKVALWIGKEEKPAWTDSQLPILEDGMKGTHNAGSTEVQAQRACTAREDHMEVKMCKKLCEDGRISDAVNSLDLLVQRGCHVSNHLFYCALKICIKDKDLNLGRRVHALSVKGGYEGDAFLATHIIGLYASLGRLEEATQVFSKIPAPDAYNWATIILAFTRHGDAAEARQAIRLYRQMLEAGVVDPDNRIYSAVLKACATATDLAAGKEVHAHILANLQKPDKFVQAGLVDMYAKCGSLDDAHNLFDKLRERNVVTWTSMIAGYARQGMGEEALCLYRRMLQEGLTPPNFVTFVCLLQACGSVGAGALDEGRQLHAQIQERAGPEEAALGSSLVNMYVKCGSIEDARRVFDKLPDRNVVAWNAMIAGYAQQGMGQEALHLYWTMVEEHRTPPNLVTYGCFLHACACVGAEALGEGKQMHAHLKDSGLENDADLGVSLVNMYVKCGSLEDARQLFDRLPKKGVVTWNVMLAAYAKQGMGHEALRLYRSMQEEGQTSANSVTYVSMLQACARVGIPALDAGKHLHAQMREQGVHQDVVLGGSLVNMYAKCGSLQDARQVFDTLPERSVVTWNVMFAAYAQHGMGQEALRLYRVMQQDSLSSPDLVTYVSLLQACAGLGAEALDEGMQLHAQITKRGMQDEVVLGSSLINMQAECGSLESARWLFDKLPERNLATWNAMLAVYAQKGMGQEALCLYNTMIEEGLTTPNYVTYLSLLQACASVGVGALQMGKQLHARIRERGPQEEVALGSSLVNMYAKCCSLNDARQFFDNLPEKNVVTWNGMLTAYSQREMGQEALSLYSSMQLEGIAPDPVTFVCILQACASLGVDGLQVGKQLHSQIKALGLQEDVALGSSLVNMYAKCGSLEDARDLFNRLPERNVVTWTTMLSAYAQREMVQEAFSLYSRMQKEGVAPPDSVVYASLLQACAVVAALPLGKRLHAEVEKRGMQGDAVVGAALVNMYAKCGCMSDSQHVFDSLPERSVKVWGALIGGYARHGDSEVVFSLLDRMTGEGTRPDDITFLSVLAVCSHAGLVEEGRQYFEAMQTDYDVAATVEHCVCMVDMLGRAGYLEEALQLTKTMALAPNGVLWHTLLAACWKWKNVEIGREAFKGAISLDEKDAASYVLMSNIYSSVQMWEAAKEIRSTREQIGAWKKPGLSWWADMAGVVHTFGVGDKKHPESEGIHARLRQLVSLLKKEGYAPHLKSSLLDLPDDEKEVGLCGHSEKLAIAYALTKTAEGTTIRIVKNLRVCEDCHTATAYISLVEKRTIICRDANRFHVFKNGKCSCGDYW